MSDHKTISEYLPEYAAGILDASESKKVEQHLAECPECQQDLQLWQWVSRATEQTSEAQEVDPKLLTPVLFEIRAGFTKQPLRTAWQIIRSQLPIVHKEIWPASLVIILIGYIASVLVGKEVIFQALAPLIAATSISTVFGSNHDPAAELSLSTPVPPVMILLARLVIVFLFNFLLACGASIGITLAIPSLSLGGLILSWLAPMCLLSSLALLISIQYRTETGLGAAYTLWLLRFLFPIILSRMQIATSSLMQSLAEMYIYFWDQSGWLIGLSIGLLVLSFWLTQSNEYKPKTIIL